MSKALDTPQALHLPNVIDSKIPRLAPEVTRGLEIVKDIVQQRTKETVTNPVFQTALAVPVLQTGAIEGAAASIALGTAAETLYLANSYLSGKELDRAAAKRFGDGVTIIQGLTSLGNNIVFSAMSADRLLKAVYDPTAAKDVVELLDSSREIRDLAPSPTDTGILTLEPVLMAPPGEAGPSIYDHRGAPSRSRETDHKSSPPRKKAPEKIQYADFERGDPSPPPMTWLPGTGSETPGSNVQVQSTRRPK